MPFLHYKVWQHAITGQGKYGYFDKLTYHHPKTKEALLMKVIQPKEGGWPVTLRMEMAIHNCQDMEKVVDAIIGIYNSMYMEHGENELISPSDFQVKY